MCMEYKELVPVKDYKINTVNALNFEQFSTVKSVFSGHLKIDKTKVLMTNGSLMKVESIT